MSSSAPLVGNLEVYVQEGNNEEQLTQGSTRYRIIEAIIDLALALLETREGRQSLVEVATAIIEKRNNAPGSSRRRPPHIYRDRLENMPFWIDRFLRRIRNNFPAVVIARTEGEAAAVKRSWGTDMNAYDAGSAAGYLWVNNLIISNMVYVRQQTPGVAGNSYSLYKFQMVVSVAHEIVHFLTGFLTGTLEPNTPPGVIAPPFEATNGNGEAGRYWESDLLGGFLEMWSVLDDPLDLRQAGEPFLFLSRAREDSTGRVVSLAYIEEFLSGRKYPYRLCRHARPQWPSLNFSLTLIPGFSFPIRTSHQAQPRRKNDLRRVGRLETSTIRQGAPSRRLGRVNSPPPRGPDDGPEPRYRRPAEDTIYGYSGSAAGYSGSGRGYAVSGGGYSGSGVGYSGPGRGYTGAGTGGDGYASRRSYR